MGTRVNGVDLSDGAALSDATPAALGVAAAGVSTDASRADHVHALPTIPAVSSATPQPIGTATAGVSADAARADHVHAPGAVTVDTLSSATGWTAIDSSTPANGEASITGGVGRLEAVSGVSQAWNGSGGYLGPSLRRAIPHVDPSHYAVSVRLAALTAASQAYAHLALNLSTTPRVAAWIRGTGEVRASLIATSTDLGTALAAGTALLDGRDWLRIVVRGRSVDFLFGRSASTSTRPTTWTHLWSRTEPDGVAYQTVSLGLASFTPPSAVTADFDDLTFEALP